jgi:hypothetical protein
MSWSSYQIRMNRFLTLAARVIWKWIEPACQKILM